MNKRAACLLSSAACVLFLHGAVLASETTTYTYDPLGRLKGVSTAGGPSNGVTVSTGFDPAGNRTNYTVAGAAAQPIARSSSKTDGGVKPVSTAKPAAGWTEP